MDADDPVVTDLLHAAAGVQDAALQVRHGGGGVAAKLAAMTVRQVAASLQVAATELEHRAGPL